MYIAVHHRLPAHETHAQNGGDRQYRRYRKILKNY